MKKISCMISAGMLAAMSAVAQADPSPHGIISMMEKYDVDRDSLISAEELAKYRSDGLAYIDNLEESITDFAKADANGDKFVSYDEFIVLPTLGAMQALGISRNAPKDRMEQMQARKSEGDESSGDIRKLLNDFIFFCYFDDSGDGKLSEAEYDRMLRLTHKRIVMTRDSLLHTEFAQLDLNGDKVLSPYEMEHFIHRLFLQSLPAFEGEKGIEANELLKQENDAKEKSQPKTE